MGWISDLASLPAVVAILVVFTVCLWWILRVMSKNIVDPFKALITNHLEHEREDRKEEKIERRKELEAIDKLIDKIDSL